MTGGETVRTMYVSAEVFNAVKDPFGEDADERLAEFRQTLDAFLEGNEISVAEDPYIKPSDAMLARVDPIAYEIWDIRSIAPHPGIRGLGGFWAKDTFVTLTWDYRENLEGEWKSEIERCRAEWQSLFGTKAPFSGASLHDYLTNFFPV